MHDMVLPDVSVMLRGLFCRVLCLWRSLGRMCVCFEGRDHCGRACTVCPPLWGVCVGASSGGVSGGEGLCLVYALCLCDFSLDV